MSKMLEIFFVNKGKDSQFAQKIFFLLHNEDSELIDDRNFNFPLVSHFVKTEPLEKNFFFFFKKSFSIFKCVSPKKKKIKKKFLSVMNKKG